MTPEQAKLAYIVFFTCFSIWLVLILTTSFLSERGTTPSIFPNYFMSALFVGSAVLSSIPAMLIGLDFLGINFQIRRGKPKSSDALPLISTRRHKLRPVQTSSIDSAKEPETKKAQNHLGNEEETSICNSTGEDWSVPEQTALTNDASIETKSVRKCSKRSKDGAKAFFLFGETEFKGCAFKPGYLKSLPKNKPIPDECFGCAQILDCVGLSGNK